MARSGLTPLSLPFSLSLIPLNWGPLLASAELPICDRWPKQRPLRLLLLTSVPLLGLLRGASPASPPPPPPPPAALFSRVILNGAWESHGAACLDDQRALDCLRGGGRLVPEPHRLPGAQPDQRRLNELHPGSADERLVRGHAAAALPAGGGGQRHPVRRPSSQPRLPRSQHGLSDLLRRRVLCQPPRRLGSRSSRPRRGAGVHAWPGEPRRDGGLPVSATL